MRINRFNDFIHMFLVNASQMAYIEDAQNTFAMLQKFNELFRYMIKKESTVMLNEEIKALRLYIDIQLTRYANKFSIYLDDSLANSDANIKHLSILDFVDNIMDKALAECEDNFCVSLKAGLEETSCITAELEYGGIKQCFKMDMPNTTNNMGDGE